MPRAPQAVHPRQQVDTTTAEYTIADPDCREIAGKRIAKGTKTIVLTQHEAAMYIASGAVTMNPPGQDKATAEAVAEPAKPIATALPASGAPIAAEPIINPPKTA